MADFPKAFDSIEYRIG